MTLSQYLGSSNDIIFVLNSSEKHIGRNKAEVIAEIAKKINPDIKIQVIHQSITSSENDLPEEIWDNADIVIGTYENKKSTQYIDKMCVLYSKPFFVGGQSRWCLNSEIIIPNKTSTLSDINEDEPGFPRDVLKNFPHRTEHIVEFVKIAFSDWFIAPFEDINALATQNSEQFLASLTYCKGERVIFIFEDQLSISWQLFRNYYTSIHMKIASELLKNGLM